ncbi:MAG: FtsX-like permease family protein [Gemmatimonadales bacterium]
MRRPRRLILFVAGVTVAAAVLLDMVMLAAGLQRSLLDLLEATGYQLRVVPKGLLPFESGAAIRDSDSLADLIRQDPRVSEAIPLWGQTLYVTSGDESSPPLATFAYGAPIGTQPALRVRQGRTIERPGEIIVDRSVADHFGITIGDSLSVGLDPDPAAGSFRRRRRMQVTGLSDFLFAPEGSATTAIPIRDLWEMSGTSNRPAAILLVRVVKDDDAFTVARDYRGKLPNVDVYALPEIVEAAGDRLTYFQQLSLVLGTVSLGVAFLLVATLLTLSVNERWGEIAALRALGVTRGRMLIQVSWQGLIISTAGTLVGLAVGLVVARYLDRILTSFPGLPVNVSFFVLEARDAFASVGLLVATGLLAGLYPAWRAASVNISLVLREEIE